MPDLITAATAAGYPLSGAEAAMLMNEFGDGRTMTFGEFTLLLTRPSDPLTAAPPLSEIRRVYEDATRTGASSG